MAGTVRNPYKVGELVEPIDLINEKLLREFGRAEFTGAPANYRVVWSNDQYEKRWTQYTHEGFELIHPEVKELPKYQGYKDRYILERFIPIPENDQLTVKAGYEPAWTFEDAMQEYLPPIYSACKFVIEAIQSQIEKANTHKRYKDPDTSPEARQKELDDMQAKLFGNETTIGDALAHKFGIVSAGDGNQHVVTPVIPESGESNGS